MLSPGHVTIHCSDTTNGSDYDIERIRADHLARGFNDVGYHLVIQPDGTAQNGRGLNAIGAHGPAAVSWMIKNGMLKSGQGLECLSEFNANRILGRIEPFIRAITGQGKA